ncbi:MAG: YggS family pyridoxal phosphate-dependent enzyme [Lachnospiraceae bacterium]|nr:YggS family pyridoxal phosphate-dependent enzyme [Lachnospiraceae bacterium]
MIKENLELINKRINDAAARSPYSQEVTLVAVSKTKPVSMIREAYDLGVRDFGENKVQELMDKIDQLPSDIRWHLIGHLQRNKVKYVVGRVYMIHSVDSLRLAEEIEKEAAKKDVTVNILIEINAAGEESKFGVKPEDAAELVSQISHFSHIKIKGFMTVAPACDDPEIIRPYFREMKKLSIDIEKSNVDNISKYVLSMGMSGDFETAIEEGADIVRIGTSIFGERIYNV